MKKPAFDAFNSRDYPAGSQLAAFQQMTASVYEAQALGDESNFMVETFGYQVNDLMFTDFKCQNARFRRIQQHLQGDNKDFLVLHAQLSGEEMLQMEHGIMRLLPGNIYLRDWAYTFESQTIDMHIRGLMIPRQNLNFSHLFNVHNPILSWSMSDPEGKFLWETWSNMFDQLANLDMTGADVMSRGFLGLLNGMMSNGNQVQARGNSKLSEMERYLRTQLRGEVSIEQLCQHFHVSRATLFRQFKEHGGLKRYIDRLRLERCYSELRYANPQLVTVGEIAAGWGYNDPRAFNRKFRKQFNLPPSKILGTWFHADTSNGSMQSTSINKLGSYRNFKRWMDNASGAK